MMNLGIHMEAAKMTLSLTGHLDAEAAREFRSIAERLLGNPPKRLVVDLRGVGFMDGAGLGAIAFLAKRLGRRVAVIGASGQPLALLLHLGLGRVFGLGGARPAPAARSMAALAWANPLGNPLGNPWGNPAV